MKAIFWLFKNPRHSSKKEANDINEDDENDQPVDKSRFLNPQLQSFYNVFNV